uniref:single-stranded DNA-binding protein n=1 Tax=Burkholderia arboris TaxID=488730 RepID=UPI003BEEE277
MPNRIEVTGNLGKAPTLKHVDTGKGRKQVTEFNMFADEYRRDDDGELSQTGGFWLRVTVWEAHAERVARLIPRGARVTVIGSLRVSTWKDDADQTQTGLDVVAEKVALELGRLESVTLKRRENDTESPAETGHGVQPAGDPLDP